MSDFENERKVGRRKIHSRHRNGEVSQEVAGFLVPRFLRETNGGHPTWNE